MEYLIYPIILFPFLWFPAAVRERVVRSMTKRSKHVIFICARYKTAQVIQKPKVSEVLTAYLKQCKEPPWTSYFVKYENIIDNQWGKSHFNWSVGSSNYHILRTGCYPYIKYHCTKRPYEPLNIEDNFFRIIKCINLGIPCLAYGIAAKYLIKHTENVEVEGNIIPIYFLYEEEKGSLY